MKLEDLKPGQLYRFEKATTNPQRDRRISRDWRAMDLPEGAELLCQFTPVDLEKDGGAESIELRPYAGLAGQQYANVHALHCGWFYPGGAIGNGTFKPHERNEEQRKLVDVVLSAIVPFEPRDVDDAKAVFNTTNGHTISYEDIALTLLDESTEPTLAVFERTQARLKRFSEETDGDNWQEHSRRVAEFCAKAFKPGDSLGDPAPEHTVKKGGAILCHGCGVLFTDSAVVTWPFETGGVKFTRHLPCRGKK